MNTATPEQTARFFKGTHPLFRKPCPEPSNVPDPLVGELVEVLHLALECIEDDLIIPVGDGATAWDNIGQVIRSTIRKATPQV